jgi:nucleoside-diphosphate-sugar epimerase
MQLLIEAQCRSVVMVGTVAEYDTDIGFLTETSPTKPATIYAVSKLSLAQMAERMALDAGINFAWARMFYLYGPEEDQRRLVAALINTLMCGERFQATAGEQVRDYVHVADAARALWHLVKGGHTGIYNVSSGYPVTIRDLIMMIAQQLDAQHLVDLGALPYRQWEPMFICGDNRKLRSTGWMPQYTLQQGLKEVVEWWQ